MKLLLCFACMVPAILVSPCGLRGISWGALGSLAPWVTKGAPRKWGKGKLKRERKREKGKRKKKGKKVGARKRKVHQHNETDITQVQLVAPEKKKLQGCQNDKGGVRRNLLQLCSRTPKLITHWAPRVCNRLDTPLWSVGSVWRPKTIEPVYIMFSLSEFYCQAVNILWMQCVPPI